MKRQHRYHFDTVQINKSLFRADCSHRFPLHQKIFSEYFFDLCVHFAWESPEQVGNLTSRHLNRSWRDVYISFPIYGYSSSFHSCLVFIVLSSFNQPVHILWDFLLRDLRIVLRTGNGSMSHHLGNAFRADTCRNQERSEAMPCLMVGQILPASDDDTQFMYLKPYHVSAWRREDGLRVIGRVIQVDNPNSG